MNGTLPRRVTLKRSRPRLYSHFDDPLDKEALASFEVSPEDVASHSFLPLLGYTKVERRMDFSGDFPALAPKERQIRYAGHIDSAIYSQYASTLSTIYDNELLRRNLGESILAYRSGIGNNVNFAKNLFDEVRARRNCVVVCLDVSKFFDNISHSILKKNLVGILGETRLSKDWLKIFIRLSNYEFVTKEDLEPVIGRIRGRRVCDVDTFRSKVRPLIQINKEAHGIPQGTPLSGLFANVSMLDLDDEIRAMMVELGGSYRRYSDDIALVFPNDDSVSEKLSDITTALSLQNLSINEKKTCISYIKGDEETQQVTGSILQYLGFVYDGKRILVRPSSMTNFYARMKRGIRQYIRGAKKKGVAASAIRKRVPIGRFTHWGDDRNFVQYVYRAAEIMESPEMKRQLRRHVQVFDREWNKMMSKHYGV
ncbi:antiviral reverse transcriptase Drt2 [Phenylobacterium sp.]|uniref:antiviral reverse transcriptase Drt2 n=1 Tax=Phenylobacterium sp. TaxID=1871053 RepID=UPI004036C2FC